jgi:hypothetical protein
MSHPTTMNMVLTEREKCPVAFDQGLWDRLVALDKQTQAVHSMRCFYHTIRRCPLVGWLRADSSFTCVIEIPLFDAEDHQPLPLYPEEIIQNLYLVRVPAKTKREWLEQKAKLEATEKKRMYEKRVHDEDRMRDARRRADRERQYAEVGKHHRLSAVVDGMKKE